MLFSLHEVSSTSLQSWWPLLRRLTYFQLSHMVAGGYAGDNRGKGSYGWDNCRGMRDSTNAGTTNVFLVELRRYFIHPRWKGEIRSADWTRGRCRKSPSKWRNQSVRDFATSTWSEKCVMEKRPMALAKVKRAMIWLTQVTGMAFIAYFNQIVFRSLR